MWGSVFDNATFVLSKYRTRASGGEASAVDRLLAELAAAAGRATPAAEAPKHAVSKARRSEAARVGPGRRAAGSARANAKGSKKRRG
jgi:hypothetical protein